MLIQSGNDASMALAEHIAGSVDAFVGLMNEAAGRLGMKNSLFRNPTGLPARGHVSSAHDMAILAQAIIAKFPQYYSIYSEREFSYNGITQHNRNRLLEPYVTTKGNKGTGLGLAIVQKSVEQHGGTLTLEDAPPAPDRTHGAMVRITLPVRHATPNTTLKVQPEPATASGGR